MPAKPRWRAIELHRGGPGFSAITLQNFNLAGHQNMKITSFPKSADSDLRSFFHRSARFVSNGIEDRRDITKGGEGNRGIDDS